MQKECKTAIFNFKECDKDLIDGLADYLDTHADKVYEFFEVGKPIEKVVINIIPTKEEYDDVYRKTHGLKEDEPLPNWFIGNCNNGVITYLSLYDFNNASHPYTEDKFDEAFDYYKKTILHEYVHFVNGVFDKVHNCCRTEKFLVEGIATYLSGQKDGLKLSLKATKEELLDRNKFFYADYYLLTKYFVENYDKDYVLEVFQSNRQARELLNNELYDKAKEFYSLAENC